MVQYNGLTGVSSSKGSTRVPPLPYLGAEDGWEEMRRLSQTKENWVGGNNKPRTYIVLRFITHNYYRTYIYIANVEIFGSKPSWTWRWFNAPLVEPANAKKHISIKAFDCIWKSKGFPLKQAPELNSDTRLKLVAAAKLYVYSSYRASLPIGFLKYWNLLSSCHFFNTMHNAHIFVFNFLVQADSRVWFHPPQRWSDLRKTILKEIPSLEKIVQFNPSINIAILIDGSIY